MEYVPSLKLKVRTCQEAIPKGNNRLPFPSIFRCFISCSVSFREDYSKDTPGFRWERIETNILEGSSQLVKWLITMVGKSESSRESRIFPMTQSLHFSGNAISAPVREDKIQHDVFVRFGNEMLWLVNNNWAVLSDEQMSNG